jgi:hypothetical protein
MGLGFCFTHHLWPLEGVFIFHNPYQFTQSDTLLTRRVAYVMFSPMTTAAFAFGSWIVGGTGFLFFPRTCVALLQPVDGQIDHEERAAASRCAEPYRIMGCM